MAVRRSPICGTSSSTRSGRPTTASRSAVRGAPYRLGSPLNPAYERCRRCASAWSGPSASDSRRPPRAASPTTGAAPSAYPATGACRSSTTARPASAQRRIRRPRRRRGEHLRRTMADLILRRDTDLTTLPWVGHRQRNWEPEPLRFIASRAIVGILGSADRIEPRLGRTARRVRLVAPFMPPR